MSTAIAVGMSMRRVTLHIDDDTLVLELDGELNTVAGYDPRQAFSVALLCTSGTITLDLSRVTTAGEDGVAALSWCSQQAVAARRVLTWS